MEVVCQGESVRYSKRSDFCEIAITAMLMLPSLPPPAARPPPRRLALRLALRSLAPGRGRLACRTVLRVVRWLSSYTQVKKCDGSGTRRCTASTQQP